jgi:transcriptional repressor NrdR
MNCPKCGESNLKVIDVRDRDCESIYRRRRCMSCGHKFSTIEYEVDLVKKGRKKK